MLRALGAGIAADRPEIHPGVRIIHPANVVLGARVFINYDCLIEARAAVVVEDDVFLAPGVRILTSTHEIGAPSRRAGPAQFLPVTIGAGTWVGAGVTVLPGVTIGAGCVIGAGSLVLSDCKPGGIYVGQPARLQRMADESGPQ
jgi:acetyltransferase-like isoleucine patch superfamily enzyme